MHKLSIFVDLSIGRGRGGPARFSFFLSSAGSSVCLHEILILIKTKTHWSFIRELCGANGRIHWHWIEMVMDDVSSRNGIRRAICVCVFVQSAKVKT